MIDQVLKILDDAIADAEGADYYLNRARDKVAALAAAREQQPVAWRYLYYDPFGRDIKIWSHEPRWNGQTPIESQPLYAAPPAPDAEDAARLDWLEQRHEGFSNLDRVISFVGKGFQAEGVEHWFPTLRAAIDAARGSEQ